MSALRWEKYASVADHAQARGWLEMQANLGLAPNTVDAYGRALEDYLGFSAAAGVDAAGASREHVARWVNALCQRPSAARASVEDRARPVGLSNATIQQRLTAVRLFYDHLMLEGVRDQNPVGRGTYTPARAFGFHGGQHEQRVRGLVRRFETLPWIPTDDEWRIVVAVMRGESLRNRTMFALSYDAALRREELCGLEIRDVDVANRMLTVRAETTKGRRRTRVVPYGPHAGTLFAAYLHQRRSLSRSPGPLFLSESNRNRAAPISIWTWSKVIERVAVRAGVPRFSTHTNRHLCLTDLARSGWELFRIASFAGHQDVRTTLKYIHLSGRDLAGPIARGMAQIHAWRAELLADELDGLHGAAEVRQ
jgi:site-specific recombinase XerD